jgi:hypothetical protein
MPFFIAQSMFLSHSGLFSFVTSMHCSSGVDNPPIDDSGSPRCAPGGAVAGAVGSLGDAAGGSVGDAVGGFVGVVVGGSVVGATAPTSGTVVGSIGEAVVASGTVVGSIGEAVVDSVNGGVGGGVAVFIWSIASWSHAPLSTESFGVKDTVIACFFNQQ